MQRVRNLGLHGKVALLVPESGVRWDRKWHIRCQFAVYNACGTWECTAKWHFLCRKMECDGTESGTCDASSQHAACAELGMHSKVALPVPESGVRWDRKWHIRCQFAACSACGTWECTAK